MTSMTASFRNFQVAYYRANPEATPKEALAAACAQFGLDYEKTVKATTEHARFIRATNAQARSILSADAKLLAAL